MQTPSWVVNTAKYIRARDTVKSGTETEIMDEYIKIGGLLRHASIEELEADAAQVKVTQEVLPKKVKKAKK